MKKQSNDLNVFTYGFLPWSYPRNWFRNIRQCFRNCKYAWQRAVRGYADQDLWSLNTFYSELIRDTLRDLADNHTGYPYGRSDEEWTKILNAIADHIDNSIEDADNEMTKKVWDAFEKMNSYVIKTEFVPVEGEQASRMVETYSDEEEYNKARDKWLEIEKIAGQWRDSEKNTAIDLLRQHFWELWD